MRFLMKKFITLIIVIISTTPLYAQDYRESIEHTIRQDHCPTCHPVIDQSALDPLGSRIINKKNKDEIFLSCIKRNEQNLCEKMIPVIKIKNTFRQITAHKEDVIQSSELENYLDETLQNFKIQYNETSPIGQIGGQFFICAVQERACAFSSLLLMPLAIALEPVNLGFYGGRKIYDLLIRKKQLRVILDSLVTEKSTTNIEIGQVRFTKLFYNLQD